MVSKPALHPRNSVSGGNPAATLKQQLPGLGDRSQLLRLSLDPGKMVPNQMIHRHKVRHVRG